VAGHDRRSGTEVLDFQALSSPNDDHTTDSGRTRRPDRRLRVDVGQGQLGTAIVTVI
jgi:hypothetical protein